MHSSPSSAPQPAPASAPSWGWVPRDGSKRAREEEGEAPTKRLASTGPKGLPIATAAPSDPYQLALNGQLEEVCAAVHADPALLQRPMSGGLFDSRTLLHCAAARGQEALTRALLELGADPSIADKRGMTAVALAKKQGHEAVVALLGAPPTPPPPTKRAYDEESVREDVREEGAPQPKRLAAATSAAASSSTLRASATTFVPRPPPCAGPAANSAAATATTKAPAAAYAAATAAASITGSGVASDYDAPQAPQAPQAAAGGTVVTVHVHCRPSTEAEEGGGGGGAPTAMPQVLSYTSRDAEGERLSAVLIDLRQRHGACVARLHNAARRSPRGVEGRIEV